MIQLAILWWVLMNLNAPTWCWVCWTICATYDVVAIIGRLIKLGDEIGEREEREG